MNFRPSQHEGRSAVSTGAMGGRVAWEMLECPLWRVQGELARASAKRATMEANSRAARVASASMVLDRRAK